MLPRSMYRSGPPMMSVVGSADRGDKTREADDAACLVYMCTRLLLSIITNIQALVNLGNAQCILTYLLTYLLHGAESFLRS